MFHYSVLHGKFKNVNKKAKIIDPPQLGFETRILKVGKSRKQFFLKLHCPKKQNEIPEKSVTIFWVN